MQSDLRMQSDSDDELSEDDRLFLERLDREINAQEESADECNGPVQLMRFYAREHFRLSSEAAGMAAAQWASLGRFVLAVFSIVSNHVKV